jgi:hypothetical protein
MKEKFNIRVKFRILSNKELCDFQACRSHTSGDIRKAALVCSYKRRRGTNAMLVVVKPFGKQHVR